MAQFTDQKKLLPHSVLDSFKFELASEIGIENKIHNDYWGEVSSKDCGRVGGKIGGNMVKLMVKRAEEALAKGQML